MKWIAALTLGFLVAGCEDAYAGDYSDTFAKTGAFGRVQIATGISHQRRVQDSAIQPMLSRASAFGALTKHATVFGI